MRTVHLHVLVENTSAREFYRRRGWTDTGQRLTHRIGGRSCLRRATTWRTEGCFLTPPDQRVLQKWSVPVVREVEVLEVTSREPLHRVMFGERVVGRFARPPADEERRQGHLTVRDVIHHFGLEDVDPQLLATLTS
jgi:hypothetical protein